jgi:hypothetical protein
MIMKSFPLILTALLRLAVLLQSLQSTRAFAVLQHAKTVRLTAASDCTIISSTASRYCPSRSSVVATTTPTTSSVSVTTTTTLWGEMSRDADVDGLKNAPFILLGAVVLGIWLFSVPSDYRRARLCSEQQVIDNPGSRCMTFETWSNGIVDYYKNGGGVNFDFTVEKEGNVWVGGESIDYQNLALDETKSN